MPLEEIPGAPNQQFGTGHSTFIRQAIHLAKQPLRKCNVDPATTGFVGRYREQRGSRRLRGYGNLIRRSRLRDFEPFFGKAVQVEVDARRRLVGCPDASAPLGVTESWTPPVARFRADLDRAGHSQEKPPGCVSLVVPGCASDEGIMAPAQIHCATERGRVRRTGDPAHHLPQERHDV